MPMILKKKKLSKKLKIHLMVVRTTFEAQWTKQDYQNTKSLV